ncbi:MAG: cation/H(+) antiporter, partial [Corynebacteriales bacterium]|nr:cation/H(+) antiporter [Mycobacteriales bacterium]
TQQTTKLLVGLAVIIVTARLMGAAVKRIGQPPVIGEIIAGVVLGPTVASGAISDAVFPKDIRSALSALATCGLVLFMFMVGLELNRSTISKNVKVGINVAVGSMVLPFGLGVALAYFLLRNHPHDRPLAFALFMGTAMSITAFPVLARILSDHNMIRTPVGASALASAAIGDVLAWIVLAGVVTFVGGSGASLWLLALVGPYLLVMWFIVRPLLQKLATKSQSNSSLSTAALAIVVVGLLLSAAATEHVGLHYIFGAFLFGAIFPHKSAENIRANILLHIEKLTAVLLLPVFFVVAGMRVNLTDIAVTGILELALILLVAVAGKFIGAYVGARVGGTEPHQSFVLATLMNTRGLTELIILSAGLELGLISERIFALMVIMAIVTTAMTGPILRILTRTRKEPATSPPDSDEHPHGEEHVLGESESTKHQLA